MDWAATFRDVVAGWLFDDVASPLPATLVLPLEKPDRDPGLASGLLSQARLAITDAYRGPDGQGPLPTRPRGSCRAGPADQLAAFLGRAV
jgi:hypothetical protein